MSSFLKKTAVVFAYHNVGVRCLSVLIAGGVEIRLVVTHQDDPKEAVWFESVARLAARHGIPVITPEDPNTEAVIDQIKKQEPDFFFSFYYRKMLEHTLLSVPREGAFNMHGSLLPHYRGRVPVNWAVIRGETETGASLHEMTLKPDQGDVLGRQRVPILPNDTAFEVFQKVTWAAEIVLEKVLPSLLEGKAPREKQNLAEGNYCYGRQPKDGVIDWSKPLQEIHNLVRGVAPPYPGAFTQINGISARILRTQLIQRPLEILDSNQTVVLHNDPEIGLWIDANEAHILKILAIDLGGEDFTPQTAASYLPPKTLLLEHKVS